MSDKELVITGSSLADHAADMLLAGMMVNGDGLRLLAEKYKALSKAAEEGESWRATALAREARVKELEIALTELLNIVDDSRGVAGYHLNGDVAEWDEFEEVDYARKALEKAAPAAVPDAISLTRKEASDVVLALAHASESNPLYSKAYGIVSDKLLAAAQKEVGP